MKTFMTIVLSVLATLGTVYALYVNGYIQITGGNIAVQFGGHHNKIEQNTDPSQTVVPLPQSSKLSENKPKEPAQQAEEQKPAETTEMKPSPVIPKTPPKVETVSEPQDNHQATATQNYRGLGRRNSSRNRRWNGYSAYPIDADYSNSSDNDCICPSPTMGEWEPVGEPE